MKIAILGNQPNGSLKDLQQAAGVRHQVDFVPWSTLVARVGRNPEIGPVESRFDAVIVRGMPLGSLEQVIFQMNVLGRWQAGGMTIVNSPRSLEISIDKYLSLSLIAAAGIDVPETTVCQTVNDAMEALEEMGGDAVVKPVFGGEGRGIFRVTDPELGLRSFRAIVNLQGVVYLQRFIEHGGTDIRLLVIGDDVIGMCRANPQDWRTNASRGAHCQACPVTDQQRELAIAAAAATQSTIAGVDLIHDSDGHAFVVEINGVPGWRRIAETNGVDVAELVLRCVTGLVEPANGPVKQPLSRR